MDSGAVVIGMKLDDDPESSRALFRRMGGSALVMEIAWIVAFGFLDR